MKNSQSLSARNELLMRKINEDAQRDQELKAQNEYLRKQLGAFLKQKQKMHEEPHQSDFGRQEQVASHSLDSSSEDESLRMARGKPRFQANSNDFRVEIPEFKGEFPDWMHTVERVFKYKDVPEDKKVKLVALRLRKYASLWWTNLCAKRARERETKMRT